MMNIVPYSFDEIQDIMRQEAIDSGLVSDSEYEGSNIAQMIRVMSYGIQSCNINTTYGVNESLLTQTTEYNNVLKLARQLGYIPKQKVSYRYVINLRPKVEGTYKIPKYSVFSSGEYKYYYFGTDVDRVFQYYILASFNTDVTLVTIKPGDIVHLDNNRKGVITEVSVNPNNPSSPDRLLKLEFSGTILKDDELSDMIICDANGILIIEGKILNVNDTRDENIEVKEGNLNLYYDEIDNPDGKKDLYTVLTDKIEGTNDPVNYIDFNYYNIEEDGIEMWVTHFDEDGQLNIKEPWLKRDYFIIDKDIFEEKSTFLPLVDIDLGTLRIYFKIADTGITPKLYSKVYTNLLESHGKDGKALSHFKLETLNENLWDIIDPDNLIVSTIGKDIEDIESVRENAPTFHNTGNRAVTRLDYISICNRDNGIIHTQCWGGEENLPYQNLGNIYFSFIPTYRATEFVSDSSNTFFQLNKIEHSDEEFNLRDDEVKAVSTAYNSNTDISTLGIFDTLESYKMITMQLHHIWNYFVDIELEVDIRKYYITKSEGSANLNLQKEIEQFFNNVVHEYDYNFFRSNIVRIIDEQLGVSTGIELNMSTSIPLYEKHLEEVPEVFNAYKNDIWFGYPYDGVLDEYQQFNIDMLPRINTANFLRDDPIGTIGNELYIRDTYRYNSAFGNASGIYLNNDIQEIDICYGTNKSVKRDLDGVIPDTNNDPVIGTVFVNDKDKTILYRLYVKDSDITKIPIEKPGYPDVETNKYLNTVLETNHYKLHDVVTEVERNELRINLSYPHDDINFHKNTVPRLNSVKYI